MKTNKDLLFDGLAEIMGVPAATLRESFAKECDERWFAKSIETKISDEEYDKGLARMKAEGPAFLAWLRNGEPFPRLN